MYQNVENKINVHTDKDSLQRSYYSDSWINDVI